MRLATRGNGTPDGELIVVSADGRLALAAGPGWPNLLAAFDYWDSAEPGLRALAARVEAGEGAPFDPANLRAPLPRSWQWLDGSAFQTHADLMQVALCFGNSVVLRQDLHHGRDRRSDPPDFVEHLHLHDRDRRHEESA